MLVHVPPFAVIQRLRRATLLGNRLHPCATFSLACAALITFAPRPAYAQAWIGEYVGRLMAQQAQHQCMMGVAPPTDEVAEARGPAVATMAAYWQSVSAVPPQSVRPLFHLSRRVRWTSGSVTQSGTALGVIADPLVTSGALPEAEPELFVRAAQGPTARGLWRVRGPSGAVVGAWLADFSRRSAAWKLNTLTVYPTGEEPPLVTQYCTKPGDVEPYRARIAAMEAAREEKQRRKGAERALRRDGKLR
jgi:hypothetical protein